MLILALAHTLACNGATSLDSGGTAPDPATVPLAGACDLAEDFGGFQVVSAESGSAVEGDVSDGVVPQSVLEEVQRSGDCYVLRRNNPYCEPACEAGETCDFDGQCLPYPTKQDLGTVTMTGLTQAVSMEPVFPGHLLRHHSAHSPL